MRLLCREVRFRPWRSAGRARICNDGGARRGDVRERREPVLDSGPKGRDSADLRLTADDRPGAPPHQKPRGNAADHRRPRRPGGATSFAPVIMPRQGDQFETHRRDGQAAAAYLRTARDGAVRTKPMTRKPRKLRWRREARPAPMLLRLAALRAEMARAAPAAEGSGGGSGQGGGGGQGAVVAAREAIAASAVAGKRSILGRLAYWSAVACLWCVIGLGVLIAYHASKLPPIDQLAVPKLRPTSRSLRPTERCSPIAAKPAAGQSP